MTIILLLLQRYRLNYWSVSDCYGWKVAWTSIISGSPNYTV